MKDKKYKILKTIKKNGSIKYLVDIEPEDINIDFIKSLEEEVNKEIKKEED